MQITNLVGLDVGGTHTDAVWVAGGSLLRSVKVPTTTDVARGAEQALEALGVDDPITRTHLGTTAFMNALVERRDLAACAALRVGASATRSLPPTSGWPLDLLERTQIPVFELEGGREYDGRSIARVDRDAVRRVARKLGLAGVEHAAITSVFGCAYPDMEQEVADVLRNERPDLHVTLSSQIGGFGILERENGTLLNEMLRPLAHREVRAYESLTAGVLWLTQNDGTVLPADLAGRLPVKALASGPTNSLRGGALLSGCEDVIVVDVGGTTTDVGRVRGGSPSPARLALEVGGIRTNFRMPDVTSAGIGGGSIIDASTGRVGPTSVGARLTEEARVFGGPVLTLTDVAVAAGHARVGDPARVRALEPGLVATVLEGVRTSLERLVDLFDDFRRAVPIVVVGGGAELIAPLIERSHPGRVRVPPHADCANAFGATRAAVSGEAQLVVSPRRTSRARALACVRSLAIERAVEAGADPSGVQIEELDDAPLTYLASAGLMVHARAIGAIADRDADRR